MSTNPNFSGMTKAEIAEWAVEQGADISTSQTKDEMIAAAEKLAQELVREAGDDAEASAEPMVATDVPAPGEGEICVTIIEAGQNPLNLTVNGKRRVLTIGRPVTLPADWRSALDDAGVHYILQE